MQTVSDDDRRQLAAEAREIIAANKYLTMSTADSTGRPWVTPVYFTLDGGGRFLWVSSPKARHSSNLAVRPEVAVVVFDSTVPIGGGRAVYCSAVAELVPEGEIDAVTAVFVARFDELAGITADALRPPGELRLYRAEITESSVLLRGADPRNSDGIDTRVAVDLDPDTTGGLGRAIQSGPPTDC